MPRRVSLDFETRSTVELRQTGSEVYARDASTTALCAAFSFSDEPDTDVFLWHPTFEPHPVDAVMMSKLERWVKRPLKDQALPAADHARLHRLFENRGGVISDRDVREWMLWTQAAFNGSETCRRNMERLLLLYKLLPEGEVELGAFLDMVQEPEVQVWAFNATFERQIWDHVMVPKFGWPAVRRESWRCSAALGATYALPRRLKDVAGALGLAEAKDQGGASLITALCKPRKPSREHPEGGWNDSRGKLVKFFDYCRQDVRTELGYKAQLRDWTPSELALWQLDQRINERGVHLDEAVARGALEMADEARKRADARVKVLTEGAVEGTTKREALVAWCLAKGVKLPDTTKETLDFLLEEPDPDEDVPAFTKDEAWRKQRWLEFPDGVFEVIQLWRATNRTSTRKYLAMLRRMCGDGRIRDLLRYHGASTGRWAGQGIQPQNFPRGALKPREADFDLIARGDFEEAALLYGEDQVMELLSSALRGALRAGPGRELTVADFAAIEARVTMWLSGQVDALDIFRKSDAKLGPDIYRVQAGEIYHVAPESIEKSGDRRQLGKKAILGLGYQMGPPKFRTSCADDGIDVSAEFSQEVVWAYRNRFYKVPEMWRDLEESAKLAVRFPHERFQACEGRILFGVRGRFLHMKLPSGRLLSYLDPRVEYVPPDEEKKRPGGEKLKFSGVNTYTRQWDVENSTYGGKLTENAVQAISRDLMVASMWRVEKAGYPVVLTVHDEVVSEHEKGHGSLKEFEALVSEVPEWAEGLPVMAEGWRGERYRK